MNKTADLANKTKVPVEELPAYIQETEKKLESLTMAFVSIKEEKEEAMRELNSVQSQLNKSREQLVQVQEKQALRSMLDNVKWERDNLSRALFACVRKLTWY